MLLFVFFVVDFFLISVKDTDGFAEIFQVPLDGSETVPEFVGAPVQFITADLRGQKSLDY